MHHFYISNNKTNVFYFMQSDYVDRVMNIGFVINSDGNTERPHEQCNSKDVGKTKTSL